MSAPFVGLGRGSGVLYGECAGVFVMVLFAPPTAEDMNLARPALRAMAERCPAGFPTLTWVLAGAGNTMDPEARAAATDVAAELAPWILSEATLIVGTGFRAAAVRTIVAALDVMSRSASPKKVFADLPVAVAWCLAQRPERDGITVAEVAASLMAMRVSIERAR